MKFWRYFGGSTIFSVVALAGAFALGLTTGGSWAAGGEALVTALILGVLETSLSFDNAVVNARILKSMNPFWRKFFLTVGVLIAVFGMRLVFPLLIVGVVSALPWGAVLVMAWQKPQEFAQILVNQHVLIDGFGGAFLLLVFTRFFFDQEKTLHWLAPLERLFGLAGRLEGVTVAITLVVILLTLGQVEVAHQLGFVVSALAGVVVYVVVEGIGSALQGGERKLLMAGWASFVYLEVLDASFSFDGVIGAFAITNSLFLMALGLGIGAFFVRSLTIQMVDAGTLTSFRYLEHGAFWAIGALALILFLGAAGVEVPEIVSGTLGFALIALSFVSSLVVNRRQKAS